MPPGDVYLQDHEQELLRQAVLMCHSLKLHAGRMASALLGSCSRPTYFVDDGPHVWFGEALQGIGAIAHVDERCRNHTGTDR